jgi:hypothetical protein
MCAGGGIAWANDIPVVAGQAYQLRVGSGGLGAAVNGTDSWFMGVDTLVARGGMGAFINSNSVGQGGGGGGWAVADRISFRGGGAGGHGGWQGWTAAAGDAAGGGGGAGGYDGECTDVCQLPH